MTISNSNLRRLDALNLISAARNEDNDTATQIASIYAQAGDNGLSAFELAHSAAQFAAQLLEQFDDPDLLIAQCRKHLLGES